MSAHVVCLTKGGGWQSCLAGEAFEAFAVRRAMVSCTVCTRVGLGWCDGLSGKCSRADVLGDAGGQWSWLQYNLAVLLGFYTVA
jgi:hypothetical protein